MCGWAALFGSPTAKYNALSITGQYRPAGSRMGVYKRSKTWHCEFTYAGQRKKFSCKTRSKPVAEAIERKIRRELEEGYNGIRRPAQPKLLSVAAKQYLGLKAITLAPRSLRLEQTNL